MDKFLWLIQQRRAWSFLIGTLTALLMALHVNYQIDVPTLTDAFTAFGGAISMAISAGLALWSLLRPKQNASMTNPLPSQG